MHLIKKILGMGAASLLLLSAPSHALNMDVGHTLTTDLSLIHICWQYRLPPRGELMKRNHQTGEAL